jgi:ribonuclease Z
VGPGGEVPLGRGIVARPFPTAHRIPSQGYLLVRQKSRLRADLVGQPREVIVAARERGEEVSEPVEVPEVAFTGDTRLDALADLPEVLSARLLILEVTFYDDRVSVESARAEGHVHLDEVIDNAHMFDNRAILFMHRSQRWSHEQALAILEQRLPPSLQERVTLMP